MKPDFVVFGFQGHRRIIPVATVFSFISFFSRERRPELPQPLLCVAVEGKGQPIAREVFPGNTAAAREVLVGKPKATLAREEGEGLMADRCFPRFPKAAPGSVRPGEAALAAAARPAGKLVLTTNTGRPTNQAPRSTRARGGWSGPSGSRNPPLSYGPCTARGMTPAWNWTVIAINRVPALRPRPPRS